MEEDIETSRASRISGHRERRRSRGVMWEMRNMVRNNEYIFKATTWGFRVKLPEPGLAEKLLVV